MRKFAFLSAAYPRKNMLDINNIRENTEEVREALLKRMKPEALDLEAILKLDEERRRLIVKVDALKAERNKFFQPTSLNKKRPQIGQSAGLEEWLELLFLNDRLIQRQSPDDPANGET